MCLNRAKGIHESCSFRVIPLPRAKQNKTKGVKDMSTNFCVSK